MSERYERLGLCGTPEQSIFSEASLGKAYLKAMGVQPWRELQPDFPAPLLGAIMGAYYGGRSEVHMRRTVTQVLYCDFLSMYPTVCTLMGLWRWVIAEGVTWRDSTVETRDLLARIELKDLQQRPTWQSLATLVRVQPNDDVFPVRAHYDHDAQYTIGLNHLTSATPLWYTLADCIAAKLLGGKCPEVLEAITFSPGPIQTGLKDFALNGNADYTIHPQTDDFFKKVIDLRSEVKAKLKKTHNARAAVLDSEQLALKLLAKASAHGLGHLLPPYEPRHAPRSIPKSVVPLPGLGRWQHDLWYRIVEAALAGRPDQPKLDLPGLDAPAASRYAATNPNLLRWFRQYNQDKPYTAQVHPFGFMHAFHAHCIAGIETPSVVAPFHRDPKVAAKHCFDRDTGKPVPIKALKTYREVLAQYHLHPESKFLQGDFTDRGETHRRHIKAASIQYIGKEANRWEEQFHLGYDPEAQIEYGLEPGDQAHLLASVREAASRCGIGQLAAAAGLSVQCVCATVRSNAIPTARTLAKLGRAASVLAQNGERDKEFLLRVGELAGLLGMRAAARTLGIDQGNLSKILSGKRRLSRMWINDLEQVYLQGP